MTNNQVVIEIYSHPSMFSPLQSELRLEEGVTKILI
jgi:hypothetical protein